MGLPEEGIPQPGGHNREGQLSGSHNRASLCGRALRRPWSDDRRACAEIWCLCDCAPIFFCFFHLYQCVEMRTGNFLTEEGQAATFRLPLHDERPLNHSIFMWLWKDVFTYHSLLSYLAFHILIHKKPPRCWQPANALKRSITYSED